MKKGEGEMLDDRYEMIDLEYLVQDERFGMEDEQYKARNVIGYLMSLALDFDPFIFFHKLNNNKLMLCRYLVSHELNVLVLFAIRWNNHHCIN